MSKTTFAAWLEEIDWVMWLPVSLYFYQDIIALAGYPAHEEEYLQTADPKPKAYTLSDVVAMRTLRYIRKFDRTVEDLIYGPNPNIILGEN